jgi:hypothetical protein
MIAQFVAALVVFWPPQLVQLSRAADDSSRCDLLVEAAGLESGLVFVEFSKKPSRSWTGHPPLSLPPFDAPLLFAPAKGPEEDAKTVATFAGQRPVFLAKCVHENEPALLSYNPKEQQVLPLGADFSALRSPAASTLFW